MKGVEKQIPRTRCKITKNNEHGDGAKLSTLLNCFGFSKETITKLSELGGEDFLELDCDEMRNDLFESGHQRSALPFSDLMRRKIFPLSIHDCAVCIVKVFKSLSIF